MPLCVEENELVDAGLNRVLTQYRESPKLLLLLKNYLSQIEGAYRSICDLENYFDINNAVGDQLTIIGKWMGFPRCHCICDTQPVFGFDCGPDATLRSILGFCDGVTWLNCGEDGISEICIDDDEVYRSFLYVRRYQMLGRYSEDDLKAALQHIYGPTALILDSGRGRVSLTPGRELTEADVALLQVVPRVLPVAPGISTRWHFGTDPIFGFGEGWGGFCEFVDYLTTVGSAPPATEAGDPLTTEAGDPLTTEAGDPLTVYPSTDSTPTPTPESGSYLTTEAGDYLILSAFSRDTDWLCDIDLKPYSC